MKRKFQCYIPEVWNRAFTVEAATQDEAMALVKQMEHAGILGDEGELQFSHVMDSEHWDVGFDSEGVPK